MSVAEVTGRIAQIQSQLAQLTPAAAPRAAVATSFSSVLGAAELAAADEGTAPWATSGTKRASAASDVLAARFAAGGASAGSGTGQAVVEEAKKYLGVPYLWGGTDPAKGLDCSGLIQLVYKKFGVDLPRVSYQQATAGRPVASLAEAKPGDILAFNSPVDHVAIYMGNNKMLEAPRTGLNVRVMDVYETPTAIRRVLPDQPAPASARVSGAGAAGALGAAGAAGASGAVAGASSLPAGTPFASLFQQAGARHGVSPTLLAAVAKQESAYNPRAVSHAGAQGLMQLMPGTAAGLGVRNSFDPAQAVDGAARLLKDLLSEFGRVDHALAAYNAGPGAVKRYGGIPPYAETQKYVPSVLAHKSTLERR
jgi:cell wall-associated NlpC family hydrolase